MRIAFVTNFCPFYRVKLFQRLARRHDVTFLFFSDASEKNWESLNPIGAGTLPVVPLHSGHAGKVRVLCRLVHQLWSQPYDVIIQGISGRFVVPLSYLIARLRDRKFILWTGFWNHPSTLFHRLSFPLVRYLYRHADACVAYGSHVKEYLVSLGVDESRVFIAWNTADNEVYSRPVSDSDSAALKESLGITSRKVVLFVGRLEPEKGLDILLRAVSRFETKPAVLVIGRGSQKETLSAFCQSHQLDSVAFLDYVPNTELYRYYHIADVVVVPSITTPLFKEPWGLIVNEAMNQGCPVIASDAVGAARGGLLEDGKNGLVVPERDDELLAAALTRVLDDPDFHQNLSLSARGTISSWTYDRMAQGFFDALQFVKPE